VLTLLISVLIILPVSLLAFEFIRYNLIVQELRNVTDAAALAGSAAIVTAPKTLPLQAIHNLALKTAEVTFEQNSVAGTQLEQGNVVVRRDSVDSAPSRTAKEAVLNLALLDSDEQVQVAGCPLVKKLRVEASYTDKPAFAYFLHLPPTFVTRAIADGGLPKLDLMICFDVSGSMDDQTQVTLVKRFWNAKQNMVDYKIMATGAIFDILKPPPTGTAVNAFWPQNLSYAAYGGQEANANPRIFSEGAYPAGNKMNGLRSGLKPRFIPSAPPFPPPDGQLPEKGKPPGNFDPQNPQNSKGNKVDPDAYPTGFTDLIVNNPPTPGFAMPNIPTIVEASRGNLEDADSFNQSKGGAQAKTNPALKGVSPRPGYYTAYWSAAQGMGQPMAGAKDAVGQFMAVLTASADVHFGLEAFSDNAGQGPNDYWAVTNRKIDDFYPAGGDDRFPVPLISLNRDISNLQEISGVFVGSGFGTINGRGDHHLLPLGPTGKTNIADAIRFAIAQLTDSTKSRYLAKKAIVLFTDGVANEPSDIYAAGSAALKEAQRACQLGIPVYTIGLSQNSDVRPLEAKMLGDGHNGSEQGIAYESGNHAVYVPVVDQESINAAFHFVARNLVVLRQYK
jgi:hypothetical protein